ncbi:hypothetical protein DOTSEDRAFT_48443 [Dothistroma septosporum NZE10]|uniref:FAD-binding PCMH-type domain-containing protein n=1 Tax=Dothistroma septosporum (strain NZE10 / CBS 128990) TaxID=675120 RepID=M2YJ96_DOTSN|nr:hypothetical protein DOTSEDRAFT_48443 [Dothistroma septosporum NZE10]
MDAADTHTSGLNDKSTDKVKSRTSDCKVFPGDNDWPNASAWQALDQVVEGQLITPIPRASSCYFNGTSQHDDSACEAVTTSWFDSYTQLDDPIELLQQVWQGLTCMPPALWSNGWNYGNCTQGGYPSHVVNITTVSDVQAAVNFARNTGVRLIIKNTGHDYMGKSTGAGALSIWTHNLRDIAFIPSYDSATTNYSGPAFKAGSGVLGVEMYQAARDQGLMLVGGECENVGVFGGYIQGGGHSPLSSVHGMAAEGALSFDVVTADGRFVTANEIDNPDLFWALRGGGGSTWGVVVSVTVKAFPQLPKGTAVFNWSYTNGNISNGTFWAAYRTYLGYFPEHADAGLHSNYFILPAGAPGVFEFQMAALVGPNMTLTEAKTKLSPFLDDLEALGLNLNITSKHFDTYYDAWRYAYPLTTLPAWISSSDGSRLWPRQNWDNQTILNATFEAQKATIDAGNSIIAYNFAPRLNPAGNQATAINPAWHNTVSHFQTIRFWSNSDPPAIQNAKREEFETSIMAKWRELSPGAGAYLNEADRSEPNFQWAFWGSKYPRLAELKKKWDPRDLFWAATAVGSEVWEVRNEDGLPNENGRLCLKDERDVERYVAMG